VPTVQHVYLLPGFFGFVQFGKLVYFSHVREFLEARLSELGLTVEVHYVRVAPTASIRARAGQVVQYLRATAPAEGAPIHFVGHSTGGLDARLAVTPNASLGGGPVEGYARRVRSVVTVATPHHGTPLASFFSTILGQKLLRLLSLGTVTVLRQGRWPLSLMLRIAAAATRLGGASGKTAALLEHLCDDILDRVPTGERDRVTSFVRAVSDDQALLPQLAPEAMDIFNASAIDRPGVRYGCVVARARPPRLTGHLVAGLSPSAQAMYGLYTWLHGQVARSSARAYPALGPAQRAALRDALGGVPALGDSDGIVPTLSQVWGEVLAAASGDHLDIIGHFDDPRHVPPHVDWISTQSGVDRSQFEALWGAVAGFIAAAALEGEAPGGAAVA
jgi:triacylglycerol lipase